MNIPIKGQRVFSYTSERIYAVISDLPTIADEFQAIEKIEQVSQDNFLFVINIHLPFSAGIYDVDVSIRDRMPYDSLTIDSRHKSKIGRFALVLKAKINPVGHSSNELAIDGDLKIGGMIRYAGGGIIKMGVTNAIKLMYDLLEKKLEEQDTSDSV